MRIIRNIGVIFIVSLLILATGGFSVYHHICHCAGEISASLFVKETCNRHHSSVEASCCEVQKARPCCENKPHQEKKNTCHGDDCCKTTVQFLKISDSFQPGIEKNSLKPCFTASMLFFIDIKEEISSTPSVNILSSDLPPPDTGRQILVSLHQLKLDPHLV